MWEVNVVSYTAKVWRVPYLLLGAAQKGVLAETQGSPVNAPLR